MNIAALFFTLAVLILVGIYLYAPFTQRRARRVTEDEHERSTLMAERDRVINALQELDFDFKLGKIPPDDYPAQRATLLQKGADILRKIDDLASEGRFDLDREDSTLAPDANGGGSAKDSSRRQKNLRDLPSRTDQKAEERIERAIAARRADASNAKPELITDDDIESMISSRRGNRKKKSAGFCPKCGKPVMVSDRFCQSCGKALA
jgi:hypothetical protein